MPCLVNVDGQCAAEGDNGEFAVEMGAEGDEVVLTQLVALVELFTVDVTTGVT